MMTLREAVTRLGGMEATCAQIDVRMRTLQRWVRDGRVRDGAAAVRLAEATTRGAGRRWHAVRVFLGA